MEDENFNKYISLQEAAKFCKYSQDYLSLRARQGKLQALKMGRNWVTTEKWLNEYLEKVEEYNNNNLKDKLKIKKFIFPPENLPVEILEQEKVLGQFKFGLPLKKISRILQPKYALTIVLTFLLLFTVGLYGRNSFKNVYEDLEIYTYNISYQTADAEKGSAGLLKEYTRWLGNQILNTGRKLANVYNDVNDFIEERIYQGYKILARFFGEPEKIVEEKSIPSPDKEGMIVVPSTDDDEKIKNKIKDSFSDEVKVEPKDEVSGFITPVFRKIEGDKYLYILVPFQNNN